MDFRLLGPIEVADHGVLVPLGGPRQRALLALLLLRANQVVSSDRLVDELWAMNAPPQAANALQATVSRLRKTPLRDRVDTRPPGYVLRVDSDELESERFERLLAQGREALASGDPDAASGLLKRALSLWRGPALADFLYEPFAQTEIARLEELRLVCLEERMEADLRLGREGELISEVEALIAEHPLRERPRGQLMLALYRVGRQADALELYRDTRRMLLDELGLEPGPSLRGLEQAILRHDPSLAPAAVSRRPLAPGPAVLPTAQARKTVSVLFADVADSTGLAERLDPEALQNVLARYFQIGSEAVARHGGTVEKFVGDALMAVFGVPELHEDDALRAVRAADQLRANVATLDADLVRELGIHLAVRVGLNTGEVVVGDAADGQALVAGEPVITAARLEQAAAPGEVLLGEATYRLVASAVEVEPLPPLTLKGKPDAVTAWRLVRLVTDAPPFPRYLDAPLVGREVELAQLRTAFERATRERSLQLVTVLGPAGIGKTRLVRELASLVAPRATVLQGRCAAYGEGITFWPLREMLMPERSELLELVRGEADADRIVDCVLTAIGLGDTATEMDEIFAATRKLLEAVGRKGPLLVVLEDLHWAASSFLDLVEHIVDFSADAPILLLCVGRPELIESRPTWGGGKRNATSLELAALAEEEAEQLLDNLPAVALSAVTRTKVKEAAEGNPLFLEQMAAMLAESAIPDAQEVPLPPTIQALLAARLERLGPGERSVLQRIAVIGRQSSLGAALELLPGSARPSAPRHLQELTRRQFLRRAPSAVAGEEVFRFRHVLIQQAVYRAIPKAHRSELHEQCANALERSGNTSGELVGYHLEQAYRYRAELGPVEEEERELASRAGTTLAQAGLNARQRGDDAGAANLLSRGLELLPADARSRGELLLALAHSFTNIGDFREAYAAFEHALAAAEAAADRGLALEAALNRSALEFHLSPGKRTLEDYARDAQLAAAELERLGHERGQARAWMAVAGYRLAAGYVAAAAEAAEHGAAAAQRARDWHLERFNLSTLALALRDGPTSASKALRRCEEMCARTDLNIRPVMSGYLSSLHAMLGNADEARRLHEFALADAEAVGNRRRIAVNEHLSRSFAETLEPAEAERKLRRSLTLLEEMGNKSTRSTVAATLAHLLCAQARDEEAERYATIAENLAGPVDYATHSFARAVHARLLAQRGELERAESLAREAVAIADRTDDIDARAWLRTDLAEVLTRVDKTDEACSALEEAVYLAAEKEDVILVERARARLAELQTSTSAGLTRK